MPDLSILKGVKLSPQILAILNGLMLFVPEYLNVGGKHIPVRATLTKIIADGDLDTEDALTLIMAFLAAASSTPLPPVVTVPVPTPGPVPAQVPVPVPPARLLWPDAVGFDVNAIELAGTGITLRGDDFSVEDKGDHYELKLGPKSPTTNLPLHSRIDFRLMYFKNGETFRFETQNPPALHLYYTSKCSASVPGLGVVSIGPGEGAEMVTSGTHVANWSPRWEQTKGMDPTLKIPDEANDKVLEITFSVPGVPGGPVSDKPLWLPKAS